MRSRLGYKDRSRKFSVRMRILYHRSLRGVDTGFEGVLWGDIPVRKYNKIKRVARNWAPLGLKAPQCGAFQGFETAV